MSIRRVHAVGPVCATRSTKLAATRSGEQPGSTLTAKIIVQQPAGQRGQEARRLDNLRRLRSESSPYDGRVGAAFVGGAKWLAITVRKRLQRSTSKAASGRPRSLGA